MKTLSNGFKKKAKLGKIEEVAVALYRAERALRLLLDSDDGGMSAKGIDNIMREVTELQSARMSIEDAVIIALQNDGIDVGLFGNDIWSLSESAMRKRHLI